MEGLLDNVETEAYLSNMETEEQRRAEEARRQLEGLNESMAASEAASVVELPLRYWLGMAFLGPAAIWWATSRLDAPEVGDLEARWLLIGAAVMGVIGLATLFLGYMRERAHPIRAKAPAFGGRTTGWRFLSIFVMIMPSIVSVNLVTINGIYAPYVIGGLLYVILAVMPAYFWHRHVVSMRKSVS